jgi:hypothetical protein
MSDKTSDIARTDTLEYWETCAREAESENGVLGLAVEHWHQVADTLKRQRDQAEKERDALRKELDAWCNTGEIATLRDQGAQP